MDDVAAWSPLLQDEENRAWDLFFTDLHFALGQRPGKDPSPSVTYLIARIFEEDPSARDTLEDDLNEKILAALQHIVPSTGRVYALDWQHPCYWFYPHRFVSAQQWDAWKVSILPDGDFMIFLAEDGHFCLYGDCVYQTICVFGQTLLDAVAARQPDIFSNAIRINGEPI